MRATHRIAVAHIQRGVGLVEILVGVVIGLIASIVMFQVISAADTQKRTASAGADAQTTGALAMYRLEQDLLHAGYGLGRLPAEYAGCTVTGSDASFAAPAISFALVPVLITDGGNAPDQLTILVGNSPILFDKVPFDDSVDVDFVKTLRSRVGFNEGDLFIGIKPGATAAATTCALLQVSRLPVTPADQIRHQPGGNNGRFNPAVAPALGDQGDVINLGPAPTVANGSGARFDIWRVRGGALVVNNRFGVTAAEVDPAIGLEVAGNVVDLQAQYGVDDGTGNVSWHDAPLAAGTDWSLVRSVRVALLVRSDQMDREEVTTSAPRWPSAARDFAFSGSEWKHYRYRLYEKTVALRNVIWSR